MTLLKSGLALFSRTNSLAAFIWRSVSSHRHLYAAALCGQPWSCGDIALFSKSQSIGWWLTLTTWCDR